MERDGDSAEGDGDAGMNHLLKHLSKRDLSLPQVEFPRIEKVIANDKSIISLGPGEPDFPTPRPLLDYGAKMLKEGKGTHYSEPQGLLELREAIARKLRKENGIKTEADNVMVSCGSEEGMFATLLTLLDPKDEVIVPSPGYVGYIPSIELVNGKPVLLKLDEEDKWEVNPDRLKKLITRKTRAIILNTPSNPTGGILGKRVLEEVADIAVDKDLLILADEAYEKIIYGKKHVSIGSFNGMQNHVITFQTFSKAYAMCGFRIGYLSAPDKIIDEINKANFYMTLAPPGISQLMGIKALSLPNKYIDSMVKEYDRRRRLIVSGLNGIGLKTMMPEGSFYAFANIGKRNSVDFSNLLLKKAKVAVIPGTEFGKYGEGYVRCSFATKYELIEKALDKIEKAIR